MNIFYKVIWSTVLEGWVVVSEISSSVKKKSCSLCTTLILASPFAFGDDITCRVPFCDADGNIVIATERNIINEFNQQDPSVTFANFGVGRYSETNIQIISGGKLTVSNLEVGVNKNSVLDIKDGGKVITINEFVMGGRSASETIVSGEGSQLNVTTAYIAPTNNSNAGGTLILNDGGKVTANTINMGGDYLSDAPTTGVASLIIGGRDYYSGNLEPGTLDVDEIVFGGGFVE